MSALRGIASGPIPAVVRLARLAALSLDDIAALEVAVRTASRAPPRAELLREGRPVAHAGLLLSGWAARVRLLDDGRRQILSLILPGELFGMCQQPRPIAVSTVVAITPIEWCVAPAAAPGSTFHDAYATSAARQEAALLAQITRLGRMTAAERICDLLLELRERLALAGLASERAFDMPLTQEALGDALGLTSVHVNRTLQALRRDGNVEWHRGQVSLSDPAALSEKVGRVEINVSAD